VKLTEIEIERFGVWQDVSLPLSNSGLNVVYGPNEAGKSTMMRFIRSILYGFRRFGSENVGATAAGANWAGALSVETSDKRCRIHRMARQGTRGAVSVTGMNEETPAEQILSGLLANTDEGVFENVFAIGLNELQELATLNRDEVADHVYGVSLGPVGQKLLDVSEIIRRECNGLLDGPSDTGEIADLFKQEQDLTDELEALAGLKDQYDESARRRESLESQTEQLKQQQTEIAGLLRGHRYLERVWKPWIKVRSIQQELQALPEFSGFPDDGLQQLAQIEADFKSAVASRNQIREQNKTLRQKYTGIESNRGLCRNAAVIQSYYDRRDSLKETGEKLEACEAEVARLERGVEDVVRELGPDWSLERLAETDISPSAHYRMIRAARGYQSASAKCKRIRRRHDRLKTACKHRAAQLKDKISRLGGLSIEEGIKAGRQRMTQVQDLGRLRLCAADLNQRREQLQREKQRLTSGADIPKWINAVLWLLIVGGIAVAAMGFTSGVMNNGLAGTCLALVGLTGIGLGFGFRQHLPERSESALDKVQQEINEADDQLRQMQESIGQLAGSKERLSGERAQEDALDAELISQAARELFELERLAEGERESQAARARLSGLRARYRDAQQDASRARQQWCLSLKGSGIAETVNTREAFESWYHVVQAAEQYRAYRTAQKSLTGYRQEIEAFRERMHEIGESIDWPNLDHTDPLDLLDAWNRELQEQLAGRSQKLELRRKAKQSRKELRRAQAQIRELKQKRGALFVQAGASDREEFQQRFEWMSQRKDLKECLDIARAELEATANTDPELAIVEDDLLEYDDDENQEATELLELQREEIDEQQRGLYEELGRLEQTMEDLENERRSTRLRCERSRVREEIRTAAENWFAMQMAGQATEGMCSRFERNCQPATLAGASEYLAQMTGGRYKNIWTPLGKRHLCIDDGAQSLRVEQLSNGTREQLFLAVRLAMVKEFSRQGIELPMVLDDIFVNFDQIRTEAAVETLMNFAESGQQILLFTCHLHLAHMFESRGIEPIWLPGHNPPMQERRAG